MEKALSICLPVYNEERCIGRTLESALDQTFDGKKEILVGANGCTDRTAKIVRNYSSKYPEVKLLEIAEKGKPNTWNILRSQAKNNFILFGDGDVYFDKQTFERLYDALSTGDKIAYGAKNIPFFNTSNPLVKILKSTDDTPQGCLYGRLYGIDNKRVQERLNVHGYTEMPEDLVLEDLWLSLVIGKSNWEIEEEAKVYFIPYAMKESLKMFKRQARGVAQIRENYGELFRQMSAEENPLSITNKIKRFTEVKGIDKKVSAVLRFLAYKTMLIYAECATRGEKLSNPLDGWETSEHSKQPIELR